MYTTIQLLTYRPPNSEANMWHLSCKGDFRKAAVHAAIAAALFVKSTCAACIRNLHVVSSHEVQPQLILFHASVDLIHSFVAVPNQQVAVLVETLQRPLCSKQSHAINISCSASRSGPGRAKAQMLRNVFEKLSSYRLSLWWNCATYESSHCE